MEKLIQGRRTAKGAFTDATVIRPDGSIYWPDKMEKSKTGNHWTTWWKDVSGCLILVIDISNSGKDNSSYYLPQFLTDAQKAALEEFEAEHPR